MYIILMLSILGLADSIYLTWEHYNNIIPPCTVHPLIPSFLIDCGKVLSSPYSLMFGIPLALIGIFHYGLMTLLILGISILKKKIFSYWLILQSLIGAIFSVYFMYIQLAVIKSICLYCTLSALISFILIFIVYFKLKKERFELHNLFYSYIYRFFIRPIFFIFDAEFIHDSIVKTGRSVSNTYIVKFIAGKLVYKDKSLKQRLVGIDFQNPVGLAAGFDYNADLTQTLPYFGFGFQTIGTITNQPYQGNPPPRLGRLPNSKSLMVNKGFKNIGSKQIIQKLTGMKFEIPTGVSIGLTNSHKIESLDLAVKDITNTFKLLEQSKTNIAYYELNISCPNLVNSKKISFYPENNLNNLLSSLKKLRIAKPIFIKMPIEVSDQKFLKILDTAKEYNFIKGIIVGNLYHRSMRKNVFDKNELNNFKSGNFSGKPCEEKSNELIKLTYRKYKNRFVIIGCGGIFSADDAYKKIKLGASLVQLITGMIYQGPQLISQINIGLIDLLEKDGFKNISQAVGYENN